MALRDYEEDVHDVESNVLTYHTEEHSEWNAKGYTMRRVAGVKSLFKSKSIKGNIMKEYKYKVKGAEYTVKINDVEGNMAKWK